MSHFYGTPNKKKHDSVSRAVNLGTNWQRLNYVKGWKNESNVGCLEGIASVGVVCVSVELVDLASAVFVFFLSQSLFRSIDIHVTSGVCALAVAEDTHTYTHTFYSIWSDLTVYLSPDRMDQCNTHQSWDQSQELLLNSTKTWEPLQQ